MNKVILTLLLLSQCSASAKDIFIFAGQSNAVSLESEAFKARYEQLTGRNIDVFNCAVGNTYIIQHAQDFATTSWKTPSTTCRQIMQTEKGKGNQIAGVAFWQGESDTFNISVRPSQYQNTWSTDWLRHFQTVQSIFRNGINQPDLPFVLIKLPTIRSGCYPTSGWINTSFFKIVQDLQSAASSVQPQTALLDLDAHNINYTCGDIHLTGQTGKYTEISELIAEKWVERFKQ